MATITQRTFVTDGVKKGISLAQEEYVRKIARLHSANWLRCRVGIVCALVPNGVSNIAGTLYFGLCASSGNPLGHPAGAGQFVGWNWGNGQWNYNAGSGGNTYYQANNFYWMKKVGGVTTTASIGGIYPLLASTVGTQRKTLLLMDVWKPAGNFYGSFYGFTANTLLGREFSVLELRDMVTRFSASYSGTSLTANVNNQVVLGDETAGALDSVDIWWTGATALEIYAVETAVLYSSANTTFL